MMQVKKAHYTSHHQVWLLLPWYVNGSLEGNDEHLVRDHLKVCLPCRGELINQQMLLEKVRETTAFQIAEQASFSKLQNRINAKSGKLLLQKAASPRLRDFSRWIIGQFTEKRWQHRTAFVFSALILVLIPVLLSVSFQIGKLQKPEFRTLSNSTSSPASKNDLRIVFADGILRKQMNEIVVSVNGIIMEGPSARNVFLVRIENPENGSNNSAGVASTLRNNSSVVFAEPLFPLPSEAD